ncbi:uncharacterized protein CEXT_187171 [Caerostris extrusa]|uniref:Uncharacterized protein n=1 Tax=Caerostris extrusa TaxID=172846 RepID=A0AAV4PAP2_CAEEX|nr:uncharacterized protein CEXT_187171 [Caerostris extrusa]
MLRIDRPAMFTTWTYKQAGHSVIDRGNRIRPERHNRKNIQKMTWRTNEWAKEFKDEVESRVGSMTIADAILGELPIELFVDNMPHTLAILEALYARVFMADGLDMSLKLLRPDSVVMQMVKVFAMQQEESSSSMSTWVLDPKHPVVASCKKLLKHQKRALEKSIKGLGQHGMVGTSENTLMNLHEALKLNLTEVIHRYKSAVQKLDELSLTPKQPVTRSISHGPAPIKASHQRQLSLRQEKSKKKAH